MPGARSILKAPPYQTPGQIKMAALRAKVGQKTAQRRDLKLQTTTAIVQSLVDRKNGLVTARDVAALAQVTGTPKDQIQEIVATARTKFSGAAVDYVDMHKQATQAALDLGRGCVDEASGVIIGGDPKALDVATRASQWAIEKMSHKGERVIEAPTKVEGSTGTKVMIGITLGGKNPTYTDAEIVDATPQS